VTLTQVMQGQWWNIIFFIPWILATGERELFLNQSQMQMQRSIFRSNANANNQLSNNDFSMSFSILQCSKIWFYNVFEMTKTKLERKLIVHFPRRTLIKEKRKSNQTKSNKTTQPLLSMIVKMKTKPRSLLKSKWKCPFEPQSKRENTST